MCRVLPGGKGGIQGGLRGGAYSVRSELVRGGRERRPTVKMGVRFKRRKKKKGDS